MSKELLCADGLVLMMMGPWKDVGIEFGIGKGSCDSGEGLQKMDLRVRGEGKFNVQERRE